jgi:hypothetical protein
MAVSNRLSRKLHEVFGTEAAQAMVDWMQRVDRGRTELRELNDLSYARFEAKLEAKVNQAIAEVRAEMKSLKIELELKIDATASKLESKMDVTLARHRADLIKWAFVFWVTALVAILAVARR